jgi:cysteine-rich repeat protein
VVAVHAGVDGTLSCDLGGATVTTFEAILTARTVCDSPASEVTCKYSSSNGGAAITGLAVAANTTYYVILDGYDAADSGQFTLACTLAPAFCGNGKVEGTEQCDDSNTTPNDGCDGDCQIESQGPADICPGVTLDLVQAGSNYIATKSGATTGMTAAYAGSCGSSASAPDQVYEFNSGVGGNVTVSIPSVGTDFDSVLYVRKGACYGSGMAEIECDDAFGDGGETITFQAPPDTDYWVFVDGYNSQSGVFRLEVTVVPTCGDGTVDTGEECDDGNQTDGDGCGGTCTIEASCAGLTENEPNPWNSPKPIVAACGTFKIPHAAITPSGDADHFQIAGLIENATVVAYAFVGTPGACPAGNDIVLSLWKAPISSPPANIGSCTGQTGSVACEETVTNGNCAELTHAITSGNAGDYIVKVHSWGTGSTIDDYGIVVSIQ